MQNKAINEMIRSFAQADASVDAFSIYDGEALRNITYGRFYEDILKAAGYFLEKNVVGQHIAIMAPNSYEYIVAFFAIAASGNTTILLNPDLTGEVLQWQCQVTDVSFACGIDVEDIVAKTGLPREKVITFSDMAANQAVSIDALPGLDAEDTLLMMLTSGTTGASKAVEFSVRNAYLHVEDTVEIADGTTRTLIVVPMYHVSGVMSVLPQLYQQHTVCMGRGIRYIIQDMPVLNPGLVPMVPSVLESLYKLLKRANTPEARAKYVGKNLAAIAVGGASSNVKICKAMMELGIQVESAYAMTETSGAGTWCIWNEDTIGSIGKPYGRVECCIKDGELLLKSPCVMKGYYKDPEETAKLLEDGWLHTGDMARCDENGYYYITGRKKNVIILSNGENVNPEEIEAKFGSCEDILECLVYSDGKGICADVYTLKEDAAAAFIKAYNEEMPFYRQVYKTFYQAEPLEKTGSGKIKRKINV